MTLKRLLMPAVATALACASGFAQDADYGKDEANKRFIPSRGLLGGREDFNYLALENQPAASGVPLGGIGAGNVQFAPDGRFVRIGLNNIHMPIRNSTASFFTLWEKSSGSAVRLVRDSGSQYGMPGVENTAYTGLFPTASLSLGETMPGVTATVKAFSSLIPHNVKDSSLPLVFFDVEVSSDHDTEISVAFSWEDFIGRGIREPESIKGMDGQLFAQKRNELCNGEWWPERPLEQTFAEKWGAAGMYGVRQFAAGPLEPKRANFQNYVNEIALLACTDGCEVSALPSFDIAEGGKAWEEFAENGKFPESGENVELLTTPGKVSGGSAVALKTSLKAGQTRTLRFVLAWFFPEMKVDREHDPLEFYWAGGSDYGRYFHNSFTRLDQIVGYGVKNRERLYSQTVEWHRPVLESTTPDWYKFKLINSGYVIYTNMILNKKGDMTVNEGGMGGLAGTMDQRISSHPFYQKFFTQLDRSEMSIFADAQQQKGNIPHFIGHYYFGIGTVGGRVPTEGDWMIDNTGGWIIQLVKDYQQTGDIDYLRKYAGRVYNGMDFLKSLMQGNIQIPIGGTTYDDFSHPPVYSYGATIYLSTLKAACQVAKALGDKEKMEEFETQFKRTYDDLVKYLWNGKFFAYGCEKDGTGRRDDILFTGQLGGQFVSRYCGWGDIIPMDMTRSSVLSQFDISLSRTPDYYANKVWDINLGHGIDNEGSQCWPFYLESYTAYTAMQAGYYEDAMEIMRHIQLVHLRQGWTWCQNLWNPAELSYMTAPVTWFSTDLLAGSGLNVPEKELRLAPVVTGKEKTVLPVFFPGFWGKVTADPKKQTLVFEVTRTFGDSPVTISRISSEDYGQPYGNRIVTDIPETVLKEGTMIDLSAHYREIVQDRLSERHLEPRW